MKKEQRKLAHGADTGTVRIATSMWGWPCHLRFVPNHEWGEKDLSLVQTSVWQAIVLRPKQGLFSAVHISPSLVRGQEL